MSEKQEWADAYADYQRRMFIWGWEDCENHKEPQREVDSYMAGFYSCYSFEEASSARAER